MGKRGGVGEYLRMLGRPRHFLTRLEHGEKHEGKWEGSASIRCVARVHIYLEACAQRRACLGRCDSTGKYGVIVRRRDLPPIPDAPRFAQMILRVIIGNYGVIVRRRDFPQIPDAPVPPNPAVLVHRRRLTQQPPPFP